jgi:hypothetical protein
MSAVYGDDLNNLILAAEECPPDQFEALHKFSRHDQLIMRKLIAHGPVLLRGGRGSGKSALMLAAARQMASDVADAPALGVYLSLRYLPLLRSRGDEYERFFLEVLVGALKSAAAQHGTEFESELNIISVQSALSDLSVRLGKRIVLLFDDAAHIGREASLHEFFDIFRTLSSSTTSCKAAIYPGVTRFGTRFDVYNDATTVDLLRNENDPGFNELFEEVALARFPDLASRINFSRSLPSKAFFGFLGQCVLGNMRAFVFAMSAVGRLRDSGEQAGLTLLTSALKDIAANYYWPLLDELKPKLGAYEAMIEPAIEMAEQIFGKSGASSRITAVVHRELTAKFSKPLEILEYAGFIVRRDASIAMKSGGRGSRFALNLCNVLERVSGARLTQELYEAWEFDLEEPVEFHRSNPEFSSISLPETRNDAELGILMMSIQHLKRSNAYPYGLTDSKIELLSAAGYSTIGALAEASRADLMQLDSVGEVTADRIKIVAQQAIWM